MLNTRMQRKDMGAAGPRRPNMGKDVSRRGFLGGAVAATGAAVGLCSMEERLLAQAVAQGDTAKAPERKPYVVPKGKLGDLEISRVVLGGNLIGGWAHSRDLIYVSALLKAYNTEEKIFETMALAEKHGINTCLLNPAYLDVARKYNETQGGHLQVISEIHVSEAGRTDDELKRDVASLIERGADTIYIQGMVGDRLLRAGRVDLIGKTMEAIHNAGLKAGVGSHTLEVTVACEEHGLPVDYYVKTFHPVDYWSAGHGEGRKEWFENGYHDNVWCTDPDKVRDFMAGVKKPWFAFKTLGAGAIQPSRGFRYAFENGADFLVVGMFDFQIPVDAEIATKTLMRKQVKERPRPWFA